MASGDFAAGMGLRQLWLTASHSPSLGTGGPGGLQIDQGVADHMAIDWIELKVQVLNKSLRKNPLD